ncbi:septum formation protein Maf [Saccharospirillum sp. MSK14-1]|uniref:Maf family protein n=1 Tax=Saccharospirillum sp. MSK14-1 TaxID=1897632 RepID=UPI000D36EB81|nr:septum formation protein Maf [Saccharospirillum sp. MSK14-1]
MQAPLLLASTSKYRAERLASLGLSFTQAAPHCDESPLPGELPDALALRLAHNKAQSLSGEFPDHVIIGSDQTAAAPDGSLLSKPGTRERACHQLLACSGQAVTFYSGVALAGPVQDAWLVTTEVRFRRLTRREVERYVAAEQPLDCAGSFKAEALGITLFDWIRSDDPNALIGLPLISLAQRLRQSNYQLP